MAHARIFAPLLAVSLLAGCSGTPANSIAADPRLAALWRQAQTQLATQSIVLNAAYAAEGLEIANNLNSDPRAMTVGSDGVQISTVPDLTVAQLQAENPGVTLTHKTDPTGVIRCPDATNTAYCAGYVLNGNSIYVAQSALYSPSGATVYEMENVILMRLGYDVHKREVHTWQTIN